MSSRSKMAYNVWVLAKLPNRKLNWKTKVEIMDESLIEKQNGNFAKPVLGSTVDLVEC